MRIQAVDEELGVCVYESISPRRILFICIQLLLHLLIISVTTMHTVLRITRSLFAEHCVNIMQVSTTATLAIDAERCQTLSSLPEFVSQLRTAAGLALEDNERSSVW